MSKEKIGGVVLPLVTPFYKDTEEVNYEALGALIDFVIENGAHGVIPCGSTGELVSMTLEEQLAVNEFTVRHVAGRIKVYACSGAYRTSDAVMLSKAAEEAGADGVMVVTPWYISPNEREIRVHYKTIREAISIPLILYHNPYLTGCHVSAECIARLYNEGIIDAVKDSDHDIYRHQTMRAMTDENFSIFYGYDNCPAEALAFYADGWITGVGTMFPAETVHLYELAKAHKIEEAKEFSMRRIRPYLHFFNDPSPEGLPSQWLATIKEGLTMRGVPVGVPRKPILPLSKGTRAELTQLLKDYGYYAPADIYDPTGGEF